MNERIKELAKQTGYIWHASGDPQIYEFTPEKLKKFAELIVADCLKQIKAGLVDESELLYEHEETTECVNEALMDAHHNIALHFGFAERFGVEE
jgi:adenosyl cobinamide kinase/adenosyl cobinamide phosphate guanylyltransferase